MKQLQNIYVFLLLLAPVAFQSCINDDLSECMSDKRIYFDYEFDLSKGGINPDDITRMNLFIFDEDGLFIKEYVDEAPQISPEYSMIVSGLETGYYRFIAWANLKEQYALSPDLVPGKTKFDDLRVLLKSIDSNREVKDELKPLLFATHAGSNSVEIMGSQSQLIHLNLVSDTYRVNVTVSGMESTRMEGYNYKIKIEDDNGIYKFDNDFSPCDKFTYTQPCRVDKEHEYDLKASLTVLRLTEKRQPRLRLINEQTKEIVVEDNLIGLIKEANQSGAAIDFNKTYEFNIRYELSKESSLVIFIYVNGWRLIRQPGELN
jgi:hypothetical protein